MRGIEIDAGDIPDLVPILAVVATQAKGATRIKNASRLRIKESNRLAAISGCLNALGGEVEETDDGLMIFGGKKLSGGGVSSYNDHRIAMAMAIAATVSNGDVIIDGIEAVSKSYPDFFKDFKSLGGQADV